MENKNARKKIGLVRLFLVNTRKNQVHASQIILEIEVSFQTDLEWFINKL